MENYSRRVRKSTYKNSGLTQNANLYCLFQHVGCDGIVGSTQQKDHCGVCGGDNDSCRIIAGIYTRTHHRYGYQQITQIPKGACHVNVTELARSRNYLGELLR